MEGTEETQRDRLGWFTIDEQGHRSYYRDDPEFVADAAAENGQDLERFREMASLDLDQEERDMLISGLSDWGGPAYGSDALAVAMGFASMDRLLEEAQGLIEAIKAEQALSIRDWTGSGCH